MGAKLLKRVANEVFNGAKGWRLGVPQLTSG